MGMQVGTMRARRIGRGKRPLLTGAATLFALAAAMPPMSAEPVEQDARVADRTFLSAMSSDSVRGTDAGSGLTASVAAHSASQSDAARQLLAQAREERATGSRVNREVGRTLRAYSRTRDEATEQPAEELASRRRAAFSSAISRAAAAGALALTDPNASVQTGLSAARFTPPAVDSFDPGFSDAAELISVVPGLRLESASIFGGYSSNSVPTRSLSNSLANTVANPLGADYDLGATVTLGYSRQGRHGTTRLTYTPSHVQRGRISEWSTTDHRLSFTNSYDLSPRWTLGMDGRAANTGLEQYWLEQPVLRQVTAAPANFDELISRLQAGEITDDEFAAMLTGSPVVDNPGGSQLDLRRILSASAGMSASYAYSRRWTVSFGARGSSNRIMQDAQGSQTPVNRYIRSATNASVYGRAAYRVSSRTQVSLAHTSTMTDSTIARSMMHNPSVNLQQRLSRHWNYQAGLGVGTIEFLDAPNRSAYRLEDGMMMTAHGTLSYVNDGHSVSINGSRRAGDTLGLGSMSTAQAGLSWNWQPRLSPWGASAGFGFSRTDFGQRNLFNREFMSNLYSAGLSRRLAPSTTFRTDYYYGDYVSPYDGVVSNMAVHRVQLSLTWRPVEQR